MAHKNNVFTPFFDKDVATPDSNDIVWYRLWVGHSVGAAHRTPAYGAMDCISICDTGNHDLCGRDDIGYNCDCLCHWEE